MEATGCNCNPDIAHLRRIGDYLHEQGLEFALDDVTDNAEGLAKAKAAGMIPILLMHDPDEAMRLVADNPAGGVVSLLELPDLVRFVAATTPLPSPLLSAP